MLSQEQVSQYEEACFPMGAFEKGRAIEKAIDVYVTLACSTQLNHKDDGAEKSAEGDWQGQEWGSTRMEVVYLLTSCKC